MLMRTVTNAQSSTSTANRELVQRKKRKTVNSVVWCHLREMVITVYSISVEFRIEARPQFHLQKSFLMVTCLSHNHKVYPDQIILLNLGGKSNYRKDVWRWNCGRTWTLNSNWNRAYLFELWSNHSYKCRQQLIEKMQINHSHNDNKKTRIIKSHSKL